jgi:hypothetical protein
VQDGARLLVAARYVERNPRAGGAGAAGDAGGLRRLLLPDAD